MTTVRFAPYRSKTFDIDGFDCGVPELNEWLRYYAGQNQRLNRARTFLLLPAANDSRQVLGYFTLVNSQLSPDHASAALNRKYPYPMPGTLLARVAIDRRYQGHGLGKRALIEAMRHTLIAMEHSASEVLILDAVDHRAAIFYSKVGFTPLARHSLRMFMLTKHIRKSLAAYSQDR